MSAKRKLKSGLSAIDDAKRALERAKHGAPAGNDQQIRTAIRELDDAESYIKRAIRELPDEQTLVRVQFGLPTFGNPSEAADSPMQSLLTLPRLSQSIFVNYESSPKGIMDTAASKLNRISELVRGLEPSNDDAYNEIWSLINDLRQTFAKHDQVLSKISTMSWHIQAIYGLADDNGHSAGRHKDWIREAVYSLTVPWMIGSG